MWDDIKKQIEKYLCEYLFKIEWRYGEGRAPFCFPPGFEIMTTADGLTIYRCILTIDFPDDDKLIISAGTPENLLQKIKEKINQTFIDFS